MLGQVNSIFGIHSLAAYNIVTAEFYGALKVLAGSTLVLDNKMVELMGGSGDGSWDAQSAGTDSKLQIKAREYPDFIYSLFGGGVVTQESPDASGGVTTLTNKKGTSVVASTGIASVAIVSGAEGDLKFGKYVVKAISPTTVMVYCSSDVDFGRGTSKLYQGDDLSILAAAVSITTGGNTLIPGFGIKLVGGAGTIGMTAGDTATFEVRPPNEKSTSIVLAPQGAVMPEFGVIAVAQRKGSGEMYEIDIPRVKGAGIPIKFDEQKFAEWDVSCAVLRDPNRQGLATARRIRPIAA